LAIQSEQCFQTPSLSSTGRAVLDTDDLDSFLASVERRAFRIARFALGNDDDALDAVQDAMLKLVSRYAKNPVSEWPALFHRILQNAITDIRRRSNVRKRWLSWFDQFGHSDSEQDNVETDSYLVDELTPNGEWKLVLEQGLEQLDQAIDNLPAKQQQVFLLRCWEGLSTRDTALAVGCSEGSVKTHYFRALNRLKDALAEHYL
jgi:RNA polymerase sigma-70 factor (ECF subfamily)